MARIPHQYLYKTHIGNYSHSSLPSNAINLENTFREYYNKHVDKYIQERNNNNHRLALCVEQGLRITHVR